MRQRWAALYDELLADTPVSTPVVAPDRTHVYYMYTVKAPRRDELKDFLAVRGIGSQIIYPTSVPDQVAYAGGGAPSRLVSAARSRAVASEILSLPIFPELTEGEVKVLAFVFNPLPEESCKMHPAFRAAFESLDDETRVALDPVLLEHRDRMYAKHLELPLSL